MGYSISPAGEPYWSEPKKCKRHPKDLRTYVDEGIYLSDIAWDGTDVSFVTPEPGFMCERCFTFVPKSRSQRGKRARQRGNAQERRIANDTGGKRVGHHGGKEDVISGIYYVQSKKDNGLFPERIWKLLAAVPSDTAVPALALFDAPGPGVKVRGIVVLKYEDWLDVTGVKE